MGRADPPICIAFGKLKPFRWRCPSNLSLDPFASKSEAPSLGSPLARLLTRAF
jgi:hypothetical protein